MPTAAVDNDILFKGLCYGLLRDFIAVIPSSIEKIGILGAARFVITAKLRRARLSHDLGEIFQSLDCFFSKAVVLEPTNEEAMMAAEIEFAAQEGNVELDTGESQLCAIAISRNIPWIVTGDKRAIRALGVVVSQVPALSSLLEDSFVSSNWYLHYLPLGMRPVSERAFAEKAKWIAHWPSVLVA
jgi:hypothetical protein